MVRFDVGMTSHPCPRPAWSSFSAACVPTPTTVASPSVSATRLPSGVTLEIADHLGDLPFYNEELDGERRPGRGVRAARAGGGRRPRLAVTPEYNGTMPAVLNNAIDWLSRPFAAGAIKGKPFAVIGATPTRFGGKWAHDDTRRSAGVAGADVLPEVVLSHSTLEADVFEDAAAFEHFLGALISLVEYDAATAAA